MRWIIAAIGILVGASLGLAYGWMANPVKISDTTAASLRIDYRTDYVLMVAEAYHGRRDPDFARRQLAILGGDSPAAVCDQAIQQARLAGYSSSDVDLLEGLLRAMQVYVPAALPGAGTP